MANESSNKFLTQEVRRNRCSNDTTNKRFRIPNERLLSEFAFQYRHLFVKRYRPSAKIESFGHEGIHTQSISKRLLAIICSIASLLRVECNNHRMIGSSFYLHISTDVRTGSGMHQQPVHYGFIAWGVGKDVRHLSLEFARAEVSRRYANCLMLLFFIELIHTDCRFEIHLGPDTS
ncbi:unnamed protein product [Heterotrigona itama]|uniref:Uncharacterized protein n=1 Tax=Heterotrigona itama TaxID=395501 RepID=A0A6V7HHR6_9HYME|nr:unnamed protein product [Heterotrigona itama]